MGRPLLNLIGQKHGLIEITSFAGVESTRSMWNYICKCGSKSKVSSANYKRIMSCGCLNKKHGHNTNKGETPTYSSWRGMLDRCLNRNHSGYHRYGGRGIRICDSFRSFINFFNVLGIRPVGCSVDRIDNDKHYSCGTCKQCKKNKWKNNVRWATPSQQRVNQRKRRR